MLGVVGSLGSLAVLSASGGAALGARTGDGLPVCAARSLQPKLYTNGAGGTIIIYANLRNADRRACLGSGRVTIALRDAKTRRLLRVVGNPHTKRLHGRLHPGENNLFALQWRNYCGPGKPMVFEESFGIQRVIERSHYPGARCETSATPSTLRLFRLPR